MVNVTFHGHAFISIISGEYNIIVDPFINGNPFCNIKVESVAATHILVTHGHGDHFGDSIKIAQNTDALIIAPYELAVLCQTKGVNAHPMHIGGSYKFPFGRVKLTPAWHGSAVIDGNNIIYTGCPCGFLINIGKKTIYHSGDTGLFSDMKLLGELNQIDCAFIPIGDNFVMGPEDAVVAAKMLQAKLTIPIHYNTFPVIKQDPYMFVKKLAEEGLEGLVMQPGEQLDLCMQE